MSPDRFMVRATAGLASRAGLWVGAGNTEYLIGSSFTVADLDVASVLSWAKIRHMDLSAYPHVDK